MQEVLFKYFPIYFPFSKESIRMSTFYLCSISAKQNKFEGDKDNDKKSILLLNALCLFGGTALYSCTRGKGFHQH